MMMATDTNTLPTFFFVFLSWLYRAMTAVKLLQWMLHWYGTRRRRRLQGNRTTTKTDRIEYKPSVQTALTLTSLMASTAEQDWTDLSKVPRKEYQQITDPMLQQYLQNYVHGKPPKTFTTLQAAQSTFFAEFTGQDNAMTSWFFGKSIKAYATAQMGAPMGLTWSLYLLPCWFLLSAAALVHARGNVHAWTLHVAVAVTITDVYVVCCKEQLTLEQGLRKYQWLDIFTRPQTHPLIGTRVCPMYQRDIQFRPDVMDFEFDLVEHKSAMPTLHERQQKKSAGNIMYSYAGLVLMIAIALILNLLQGQVPVEFWSYRHVVYQTFIGTLPTALLFYGVRLIVDTNMGADWDNWWTL